MYKMKLNDIQKAERKRWKKRLEKDGGYMYVTDDGHTFVVIPLGFTDRISCAVLNQADTYSRKYGEWLALSRMYNDAEYITVPAGSI